MIEELTHEERLLEARRAIRRQLIAHGQRQVGLASLFVVGAAALALWSSTIPNDVGGALLIGLVVGAVVITQGHLDRCPRCEGTVDVFDELHCSRCGEALDELPLLPPGFAEAREELEAELAEPSGPVEVADGIEVTA